MCELEGKSWEWEGDVHWRVLEQISVFFRWAVSSMGEGGEELEEL